MQIDPDVPPIADPHAQLEDLLIQEYLTVRGHNRQALQARDDPQARAILAEASQHAVLHLADADCKAHRARNNHGV